MDCCLQGLPAVENHGGGKLGCHPGLAMRRGGLLGWGGDTQQQESLTRMDCISLTDTQWLLEGSVSESWEAAPQPRDQEGSH